MFLKVNSKLLKIISLVPNPLLYMVTVVSMSVSHLAESAAYPSMSVSKVDIHSTSVIILKRSSDSNVSESISIQVCEAGYGGAKSTHGWSHHGEFTFQLQL